MKFDKTTLQLYAVTDRYWLKEETLCEQTEKAIRGGVTFVQLREKNLIKEEFLKEAIKIQSLCKKYNIPFVINDDIEIAKKINADGVHVGQNDMDASNARLILGNDKILGVSVHTVQQAVLAEKQGADYIGVGAVFNTNSKSDAEYVPGNTLKEICKAVKIPVVAIGGICENNVLLLKDSGISGIAVISAIFGANDIESATVKLKELTKRVVSQ